MKVKPLDPGRCSEHVTAPGMRGFFTHQCTRKPWQDGFCKQHHPDTIKERERKREETRAPTVWERLVLAHNRINALEKENARLRKQVKRLKERYDF